MSMGIMITSSIKTYWKQDSRKIAALSLAAGLTLTSSLCATEDAEAAPPSKAPEAAESSTPEASPAASPEASPAAESAQAPPISATIGGLTFPLPKGWESVEPESRMRAAQWKIAEGDEAGEAVFFYFGKDQGGSVEANFARWIGQFKEPAEALNAQRADLVGEKAKVNFIRAIGTYNASMPGQSMPDQPNTMLIGAVVEGPEGNVFAKFTGPAELVGKNEKDFLLSLATASGVPLEGQE